MITKTPQARDGEMAAPGKPDTTSKGSDAAQPTNREERRRRRFRPWSGPPTATGHPAVEGPHEAQAGAPDQDVTRLTGPGTGGATETAGRTPHHEGAHVSITTKG
jgi:hypothetical protein